MSLDEKAAAEFKQTLREMSDEELRLGLDIGTINLGWKRSLAEMDWKRREDEELAARFAAQESARVRSQKFQAAQMEEHLEVAREQAGAAKDAATAATQAAGATRWIAGATIALAAATFFLAAVTAAPLVSKWFSAPAVEEVQPPASSEPVPKTGS